MDSEFNLVDYCSNGSISIYRYGTVASSTEKVDSQRSLAHYFLFKNNTNKTIMETRCAHGKLVTPLHRQ